MTERLEKELALLPTVEKILASFATSPVHIESAGMSLKDALIFLPEGWMILDEISRIVKISPDPRCRPESMLIHKPLPIVGIHDEFVMFQREPFMKAARAFMYRVKVAELRAAMEQAWRNAQLSTSPFPTSGSLMFDSTPRGAEEIYREAIRRMGASTGIKVKSSDESAMMKKPSAAEPFVLKNVRLSWPEFTKPRLSAEETKRSVSVTADELSPENIALFFLGESSTVASKAPPEIEMDYETRLHRRVQKLEGALERLSAAFTALNIGQRLTSAEATMAHVYPAMFPERCVEPAPEPVAMPNNPLTDYGTPDVTNDVVSASVRTMSLHEEAPAVAMPNNFPAAGIVVRVFRDVTMESAPIEGWYAMSGSTYKWGMFDANGFPIEIGPHSRWQLVQGSADLNPFYKV